MTLPPLAGSPLHYGQGTLTMENVSLEQIADQVGTPCFVYSTAAIETAYKAIDASLAFAPHEISYAVKANGNIAILNLLRMLGAGADIVSGGELARCQKAGFQNERIVFSGVGKSHEELRSAIKANIRSIHVESEAELDHIHTICQELQTDVSLCFRVNPNIDAKTHPYISTGLKSTKFGLDIEKARGLYDKIKQSPYLKLKGLACHIGSQLPSAEPLRDAIEIVALLCKELMAKGATLQTLDAGGGWPINYGNEKQEHPPLEAYGKAIEEGLNKAGAANLGLCVQVEPGRSIVGPSGVLLSRVLLNKTQGNKRFTVLDAAMTELLRPALYQAYHPIWPVRESKAERPSLLTDVVGPVCETADFIALNRELPPLEEQALLAIGNAGAYSSSMASNYNARRRPAEVLVHDDGFRIVRARESYDDLWRLESL